MKNKKVLHSSQEKRFFGILNASAKKRYRNFISTVADKEEVWLLENGEGYATFDDEEKIYLLVWPEQEFAKWFSKEDENAVSIEVHEFCRRCLEMKDDSKIQFMVFPTEKDSWVVDTESILANILEELNRVEYIDDFLEELENLQHNKERKFMEMKNINIDFFSWLDEILSQEFSKDTVAICFNLYEEEENKWAVELIGTDEFDEEDDDWACDEIIAFRDNLFYFEMDADWEEVWEKVNEIILKYFDNGTKAKKLLQYDAVATGFVDSELQILYKK